MQGLAGGPAPVPVQGGAPIPWARLVAEGHAVRRVITDAELQAAFAGSLWEDDDPEVREGGVYLDLWIIDIGPEAVAAGVLDAETLAARNRFMEIADNDEPILVMANGRHGLVSAEFVRNTAPDLLSASQGGLPVALRDGDFEVGLAAGVPAFEHRMILRTDRRLGFDPTREWALSIRAVREHGMFRPEIGVREFTVTAAADPDLFTRPGVVVPRPVWVEAMLARAVDLGVLAALLLALAWVLWRRMHRLAGLRHYVPLRLAVLAGVVGFVGWWGQGQLSVVTVTGVVRAGVEGGSFAFLLYDPFSLVIWGAVLVSFLVWGRGFFCGWLCPYGAMQELSHALGRRLGARTLRVPEAWARRLRPVKYAVLAVLVASALWAPGWNDVLAEVEPFKTALTVGFWREWWYVAYALGWLVLGVWVFKAFCRFVCPLGAVMALGGLIRRRDWIPRRAQCGSPCQLCRVKCAYGAIAPGGAIRYDECFQCLDCVTIHDDPGQCVPLIQAARGRR